MKPHQTASMLKAQARGALLGHYLALCGAYFTLALLRYFVTAPMGLYSIHPPFGMLLYYGITFGVDVFFGIFHAGIAFLFLSNACGRPVSSPGVFVGFFLGPGKAMQIQLLPSLLLLIPNSVADALLTRYLATLQDRWLYWGLLCTLLFLPFVLYVKILYSQVYFIMLDFPEMSASECLRYSRRLMKGNKGRYLYLMLSFLPLMLLGVLTCGIGLLYVYPYRQQTYATFYLDLVANQKRPA